MGLNGKTASKNRTTLAGNDDGKPKRRPFKVGPYRASSAVESWNNIKAPVIKSTRLTRSQSVESTGQGISKYKQNGKNSAGSSLQHELVVSPRKIWTTLSQKESSPNVSHPTGQRLDHHHPITTTATTNKRRPFSFSRGFDAQDSVSISGGGGDDADDDDGGDDFDYQNYVPQPESQGRSPRVHFAPLPLHINEDNKDNKPFKKSKDKRISKKSNATHRAKSTADASQPSSGEEPLLEPVKSQSQQDGNNSSDRKLREEMSQTDDLLMNVGNFVTDFTSARTKNFPVPLNFSYSPNPSSSNNNANKGTQENHTKIEQGNTIVNTSMESVEGLNTIQCPSIIMMESARSNLFSPGQSFSRNPPFISGGQSISRPTSASSSFFRSVSSDDIHGRIALTLKMIEQEEQQRDSMKSSSSIPDKLDMIETLVGGSSLSGNAIWSNNAPFALYPTSLHSTSVSEIGTRPPSSQSSVHNGHATLQPQFENNFMHQQLKQLSSERPQQQQISPQPTHFTQTCSITDINGNGSFMEKPHNNMDNFLMPQHKQNEPLIISVPNQTSETGIPFIPPLPRGHSPLETCNEKTKKLFSFLDEAEKADRDTLLGLSSNSSSGNVIDQSHCITQTKSRTSSTTASQRQGGVGGEQGSNLSFLQKIDSLINKGSVELAKEHIILERKFEESLQRISVLEETLIHQRELNMRNLRNSERDLKKRLRLQKEEFDLAFVRNEALINEMVAEKRALQERCDKLMKTFDETEDKYKDQIKSLHQKHLDEIKRLRKSQITAESVKKQQWMGSKTQEIREMTVKGLEPEVQRIIQRHQQEMTEMRAWHSDELRETEERCQRKLHMQIQDMREKVSAEAEDMITREKEQFTSRFEASLKERESEFDQIRRRLANELQEERERSAREETKLKETMQENVRKAQIKGEVELENLQQEHEAKLATIERRHVSEINSMKDVHQAETQTLVSKLTKQFEVTLKDKENDVVADMKLQMENELRGREKRLKEEFEKVRRDEDATSDNRFKRMQEKFTSDLQEMDQSEKDLKCKLNQAKSQLLLVEEQVYSLKTALSMKEKQSCELQDANMKMLEERSNLTSVIRREFSSQIEALEVEVKGMRSNLVEIQSKHKLELEHKSLENDKLIHEKDAEIDQIGLRVQQTIARKDETIQGLQKELDKLNFQVEHLEGLLEEQRKNLVDSMTKATTNNGGANKRK